MTRIGLLCLSLLTVHGCASTVAEKTAANDSEEVCHREYKVGSMMPVRNCEPGLTEEERQRTIDGLRSIMQPKPSLPPPGFKG